MPWRCGVFDEITLSCIRNWIDQTISILTRFRSTFRMYRYPNLRAQIVTKI